MVIASTSVAAVQLFDDMTANGNEPVTIHDMQDRAVDPEILRQAIPDE
jgi:hypothetical protein